MLRIEKIQVQGFKSFCDPTEIVFDQVGITAVVGPNGCGKSNVADALSWVIGEQRARALRGGKMEDVIFQGSRNRQPAGMAEVLLTLLVQEDFEITEKQADGHPEPESAQPFQSPTRTKKKVSFQSGDRIVVGRRLYRTGESEYEMNGRVCRLRDIQELFIGTGLSGAHYAIIEQGRVGQILSARPLERRALIEEAAGISKFRMQQHAAELKLEASRQNLARITDILAEVERQHNSLKRQASKARRYQRLRNEMRQLMRSLYAYDYQDTEQRINRLQAQISSLAQTETDEQSRLEAIEERHQEAVRINNRITEQANAAREKISQITLEAERLQQQKFYLREQLQELSRRAEDQIREEQTAIQRKELTEQEISRLRLDLKQLEEEINSSGKLLSSEENEHLTLQERDSAAQAGLKELRQAIYESATQLERWRQLRRQFADAVERHQQKLSGAGLEKERASIQLSGIQEQIASLTERLNEVQGEHQETIRQIRSTDENLHNLSAERDSAQEQYLSLQRNLASSGSRLDSLLELDQKKSAFTEAVQEILRLNSEHTSDNQTGHPPGTLADLIHTSPEYEVMLEAALRDELQYILVPDLHQALTFLDYLNREKPGRASFLTTKLPEQEEEEKENRCRSLSDAVTGNRDSSDLRLIEILGLDSGVRAVFERVFPQLAAARIVKDTAEAITLSRHDRDNIYITATGERVIQGAFLTGGSSAERRLGILTIKREMTELQASITELKSRTQQAESELTTLTSRIHSLNTERQVLDTRIRQAEQTIPILREQLQQSRREQERTETWLSVISRETLQEEPELREAQQKLEQASQAAEAENERHLALETEIEEAQTKAAQLRQETEARIARLSGRRAEIATRTERRRSLLNELHRLEQESHSISRKLALQQTDAAQAADKASEIRNSLRTIEESLTVKEQEHNLSLKQLEEVTAKLQTERQRAEEQEQEIRTLRASLLALRDEKSTLKIELASNSAQVTHLAERCRNDLGEEITSLTNTTFHNQERPSAGRYQTLVKEMDDTEAEADVFDENGEMEAFVPWSSQIPESADQSAFDPDQARARLADLRDKLDKLGPVNLVALNEIAETSERIRFLNEQKADIEKAVLDTQAAFSEIRRRSKERFREAFQIINAHFTSTFQELFGGGQGEMRLIDENDPLESGIEIIAQPPGKRLQNVLLLSGGEKAMTAIALVMAIFKYRPSPFCLLDEVDAPLDEINIGRFADKILEMSQQTQFMVITHSKRTMEAAGTLYGVTMEDPGISRLVSVRLS